MARLDGVSGEQNEHKNVDETSFGKCTNNGMLPNLIHEKTGQTNLHYKQMKLPTTLGTLST